MWRAAPPALALATAITVGACAGRPAIAPVAPPEQPPQLDIADPWIDPELDQPRDGAEPAPLDRAAATRNPAATPVVIRGATVLTAAGQRLANGVVVLEGGAITHVGAEPATLPAGARIIDGRGKFVAPGLIDAHSHIGVFPAPAAGAHGDGNEATAPVTAGVRARWGYWPQDPQITRALAGGVTTALILPGSANLIGGQGFTVAMRPGRTAAEVAFPGAPATVKMACGENPKRVYGEKGGPQTRMGVYAGFRAAFLEGAAHAARQATYARARALWIKKRDRAAELDAARAAARQPGVIPAQPAPEPPPRDLRLDTLAAIVRGEVLVQIHCYRASEMAEMVAIADEVGFRIRSFHHALEAYKIRDLLVAHDIAINTWSDWWGFKLEAFDGIPENAALFAEQGGRPTIHSDSAIEIQRLNQDAAKAMADGRAAGIEISDDQALRWVTANPAWVLGIDDVTGTLTAGKRADVVVWSADPLSVYAKAELVFIAGELAYDRARGRDATDFELGNWGDDAPAATPGKAPGVTR